MELFDVIDSKVILPDRLYQGKKPMQKEFPTEQLTYGLFGKKRAEYRFFYRNAHKTRILFRENLILPRQDTSRQETNHWNLHFGN